MCIKIIICCENQKWNMCHKVNVFSFLVMIVSIGENDIGDTLDIISEKKSLYLSYICNI